MKERAEKHKEECREIESKKQKRMKPKTHTLILSSLPNPLRTFLTSISLNLPFPSPFKALTNALFPWTPLLPPPHQNHHDTHSNTLSSSHHLALHVLLLQSQVSYPSTNLKNLSKCSLGLVMHATGQLKIMTIENVLKVFCGVRFYGCVRIGWKLVRIPSAKKVSQFEKV